jgi:soluble lytic murein transglycosylase
MRKTFVAVMAIALVGAFGPTPRADEPARPVPLLQPTDHPRVPADLTRLWLVPDKSRASAPPAFSTELVRAIRMQAGGEYTKALTVLSEASARRGPLAQYAEYYSAQALLKLGRASEARKAFQTLQMGNPVGYLTLAAALGEAESDEALGDNAGAVSVYALLIDAKIGAADDLWMRLGRAAKASGDFPRATEAFAHVYYEFALSENAPAAGAELDHLRSLSEEFRLNLGRAERLFAVKQYGPARVAFQSLLTDAAGDDRELVRIRLAECDFYQKRQRSAREALRPFIDTASRQGEALYFYALASFDVGDKAEYFKSLRRIVEQFPSQTWAEDALDSLASYYITQNDDEQADVVFREMYGKYPKGSHAERAAWKVGWRSYRAGRYDETVRYFEQAAHDFPRSDYRPPWLYWSGRAHEALNERALAEERYKLAAADYVNTYHGRLALERLDGWKPGPRIILASTVDAGSPSTPLLPPMPANAQLVRDLLAADLFDQALNELQYASRVWGDSPQIEATIAWIERQQGRSETGTKQFNLFRGSINAMKRAYPQYMAAGGEELPRDVLAMIYPLAYWDLIQKYSTVNNVDPYLVAALVAQESTFVPDIKSYANAIGLTQLEAPTARQYARQLKIVYSPRVLTNPESNIRIGTTYLGELMRQFAGDTYLALAAYNAGATPVRRWQNERPGVEREEFIDDIPYPQTQNYVKKLLSTAEDYRRLYGPSAPRGNEPDLDVKLASNLPRPPATPSSMAPKTPAKATPAKPAAGKASTAPKKKTTAAKSASR